MTAIRTRFFEGAYCSPWPDGLAAYGGHSQRKRHGRQGRGRWFTSTPLPGRHFPRRTNHSSMDQKSLLFQPHVIVVLAGRDGGIPEQRQRAAQHLLAVD